MKKCPARLVWAAMAAMLLGSAVIACSASLLPGRILQNLEQRGDTPESASATSLDTPAVLPNFRAEAAALVESLPHYQISVAVDPEAATLQGLSVVTYTNTEAIPLSSLYFRLFPNGHKSYGDGSLSVTRALVNGVAVEPVSSLSESVLEVPLVEELDPGSQVKIEFKFSGIIPENFRREAEMTGYGIYNKEQDVIALSGWYPLLAVYDEAGWNLDPVSAIGDSVFSESAFYNVEVTTSKEMVLITTGVTTGRQTVGDLTRHKLVSGPVRDFFMIMGPHFRHKSREVDGVQVNSYYRPGSKKGGEGSLSVAGQALHLFNFRYGSYPYGELDIVEAPLQYAAGVEFPTIVLIGSSQYQDPDNGLLSYVVAHEVAHQWWYGLVGNDVIDDPWLDEALAMYSDVVYLEETGGSPAYNGFIQYLKDEYDILVKEGLDDQITQDLGYFEGLNNPEHYSAIVYRKGALFFDALRNEIGDDAFFRALQVYFQDHRYKVARSGDLLGAFESAANRSLSDFYESWLYSSGDG